MKIDRLLKVLTGLCICVAGVLFVVAKQGDGSLRVTTAEQESTYEASQQPESETEPSSATSSVYEKRIYVHVCGAVNLPGLYELSEGSRISDAIEAAGGFTADADQTFLNLAQVITDSQQIKVPTVGEAQSQSAAAHDASMGIVDINTANVTQLMTLPGIGQVRAEAIISYRNEHGTFAKKADIMNVSGIGESAYEKIKDKIKVESS